VRIWDNIFAYGTRFLLMTAIAVLKLIEKTLMHRDIDEILEIFDKFKDGEANGSKQWDLMPDFEEIIAEAIRIGNQYITPARVDQMFEEYDRTHAREDICTPDNQLEVDSN